MEDLLQALGAGSSQVQRYAHWEGGEPDVAREAERVPPWDHELVVAKSLGVLIAARALLDHTMSARAVVLIGTPLGQLSSEHREDCATAFSGIDSLFVQQREDFTGSFADVEAFAAAIAESESAMIEGRDHRYGDVQALARVIRPWLDGNAIVV